MFACSRESTSGKKKKRNWFGMRKHRSTAATKKRSRKQYDARRRVDDSMRKRRRTFDDWDVMSWTREALSLEARAAADREQRVLETTRRNGINQATNVPRLSKTVSALNAIDEDRSRFYQAIDEPLSLICGACGTFNAVSSCRWRAVDFDDPYFSPLLASSTYDSTRGIYTSAISSPTNGFSRVAICDRCDISLKKHQKPKYCIASGFRIGEISPELAVVNSIECRLIGLGVAFTTCFKIKESGQECTKGHSISYWNDPCKTALSLPRPLAQSGVVRLHTRGAESTGGVFTVRPNLVRQALLWLIKNNPLYKNVNISEEALQSLADCQSTVPTLSIDEHDSNDTNNANHADDDEAFYEDESFELQTGGGSRTETDEILAAIRDKNPECVDAYMERPSNLINEYTTNTLMQSCFPTLFPDGVGGFNATSFEKRDHSYDLADYCAHLMRWYDRRFVIHPNFKFFCLNLVQRRQVDGLTRRLVSQRGEDNMDSSGKDKEQFSKRAKSLLKDLKPYFRSVRGSGLYWHDVRDELMGMIGNRVLPTSYPTFFFTLSAADTIWPDFFCACDPSLTLEQAAALPSSKRRRYLNENPDIASRHFYRRFKAFFDHVLLGKSQPLGKIVDYFWRVEFQRRGSPHIHGLLWVEGAPDVLKESKTSDGRVSLANFVDNFISASTFRQDTVCTCTKCVHSELHAGRDVLADRHPPSHDQSATRCDIAQLVARVQQHRCFPGASCRVKTGKCRFSFPKTVQDATIVRSDTTPDGLSSFNVECKRDDPYTNGFNPQILQVWRANMDVKLVGNAYGAAEYTAAYVSKAEPDTEKFRNAITIALEKHPDATYLSSLRRVANASIATREVSAQEALWILQRSLPMCGKSRNVLQVKSLRHAQRFYRVNMATCLHEMETPPEPSDASPRLDGLEKAYIARPSCDVFDKMTYRYFCEHYEPCSEKPSKAQRLKRWPRQDQMGFIKERRSPQAVVKSPRMRLDPMNPDYCFSELLLHTTWRDVSELPHTDDECIKAFESFQNPEHLQAIERQHQLDLQADKDVRPTTEGFEQTQWQFSGVSMQTSEESISVREAYSTSPPEFLHDRTEYDRARNFIDHVVKPFVVEHKQGDVLAASEARRCEYQYPIHLETHNMTEDQWYPFALCMKQSRLRRAAMCGGEKACQPLQMILNGEGGSGKSWLIRHIVKDVHKVWSESSIKVRQSRRVLLMAHHGTAAFNIKGVTIYSALGFGATVRFNKPYEPLQQSKAGARTLRSLQDKYKDVQLIIIDEYSVISCGMLHWMDLRMRELWPDCRDSPFGGRDIILAGDMGQLPSVMPMSLASPLESITNKSQLAGRTLWQSISIVCTLRSQQRGAEDPEWYRALARLRSMNESNSDIQLFNTRHFAHDDMPLWNQNATHIAYRNVDVDAANAECLTRCKTKIQHIQSTHSVLPNLRAGDVSQPLDIGVIEAALHVAEQPDSSRDRCVPVAVDLAVGVPVTITHNLAQNAGLCNGTKATVIDFIYTSSSSLPVVLVQVQDKYIGPSYLIGTDNVVPIPPHNISWLSADKTYRTTRSGLPLRLGFAMTIHKVQGLTCSKLVFNPVAIPTSTYAYVGLSRVRRREDVILTRSLQPLRSQLQQKTRDIREKEWERLDGHDQSTRSNTAQLVLQMKNLATAENSL